MQTEEAKPAAAEPAAEPAPAAAAAVPQLQPLEGSASSAGAAAGSAAPAPVPAATVPPIAPVPAPAAGTAGAAKAAAEDGAAAAPPAEKKPPPPPSVLWKPSLLINTLLLERAGAAAGEQPAVGVNGGAAGGAAAQAEFEYGSEDFAAVLKSDSQRCTVKIPAASLTSANPALAARALWGTEIFSQDSDLVAVLLHLSYISVTEEHPRSMVAVHARLRVTPPLSHYTASSSHGIRSQYRSGDSKTDQCSFVVESASAVHETAQSGESSGLFTRMMKVTNRPMATESGELHPTVCTHQPPIPIKSPHVAKDSASHALPDLTVVYDLAMEPALKYSLASVLDSAEEVQWDPEDMKQRAKSKSRKAKQKESGEGDDDDDEDDDDEEGEAAVDGEDDAGARLNDDDEAYEDDAAAKSSKSSKSKKKKKGRQGGSKKDGADAMDTDGDGGGRDSVSPYENGDPSEKLGDGDGTDEDRARLSAERKASLLRTFPSAQRTTSRLQGSCMYLESIAGERFEISQEDQVESSCTYTIAQVISPMLIGQAQLSQLRKPLPAEHVTAMGSGLRWSDFLWGAEGLTLQVDGSWIGMRLTCIRYVSRTEPALNSFKPKEVDLSGVVSVAGSRAKASKKSKGAKKAKGGKSSQEDSGAAEAQMEPGAAEDEPAGKRRGGRRTPTESSAADAEPAPSRGRRGKAAEEQPAAAAGGRSSRASRAEAPAKPKPKGKRKR